MILDSGFTDVYRLDQHPGQLRIADNTKVTEHLNLLTLSAIFSRDWDCGQLLLKTSLQLFCANSVFTSVSL